jgi:phage/plasmid-like protein (TIGR03299 family)
MAHMVETMAYRNAEPWHGLGTRLTEGQPLEAWLEEAGMTWSYLEAPVLYQAGTGVRDFADQKVLFRSDTLAPLSVVSRRYQVVQPRDVLEFYRDLVEVGGFELETAGVLKGGRKLWALAKTGQEAVLRGGDRVKSYLLLATACDGTLATTAQFTSVRVVCNNTLTMAVGNSAGAVKVPHSTKFEPEQVKRALGVGVSTFQEFMYRMRLLAERRVTAGEAEAFAHEVLTMPATSEKAAETASNAVLALFHGKAIGASLDAANDTAWGLLNAVTEFVDHGRRARSPSNRLDSAWFGVGATIKQRALDAALQLVA